jgi:hypothetical protein
MKVIISDNTAHYPFIEFNFAMMMEFGLVG